MSPSSPLMDADVFKTLYDMYTFMDANIVATIDQVLDEPHPEVNYRVAKALHDETSGIFRAIEESLRPADSGPLSDNDKSTLCLRIVIVQALRGNEAMRTRKLNQLIYN